MVDNDSFHSRLGSDVPERWVDLDTRPWQCIEYSRLFRFARGYDSHDVHILGDPVCANFSRVLEGQDLPRGGNGRFVPLSLLSFPNFGLIVDLYLTDTSYIPCMDNTKHWTKYGGVSVVCKCNKL